MGLIKKVFKGVKKVFKKVGAAFGKLMKNKFFKWVVIAGAVVFTAGAAAGAMGLAGTSTGFFGALANSPITAGVFKAGASFGTGLTGAGAAAAAAPGAVVAPSAAVVAPTAAGATGALSGTSVSLATGATPGAAGLFGSAAPALTAETAGTLGTLGSASTAGAAGSGGLLGAASKLATGIANNPGQALLAANVIQGATATDEGDLAKAQMRRQRQQDNRYGVNNYSDQSNLDIGADGDALDRVGEAYTGGLLERVRQQSANNPAQIQSPGPINAQYPTPPGALPPSLQRV